MKMFFGAFGLHNPAGVGPLQEHNCYPIGIETTAGIDLDYSAILIADKFILDKSAYEHVEMFKNAFLKPMYHSLSVLKGEGLLEIQDYGALTGCYKNAIDKKTNALLEEVGPWLSTARQQWAILKPQLQAFHKDFGSKGNEMKNVAHYGILNYLQNHGATEDNREFERLHQLFESRRKTLTVTETEDVREILRPLVSHVLLNDLLRTKLAQPLLDWDDAQGFYDRLHLASWDDVAGNFPGVGVATQAKLLFEVVVPELRPKTIEEVVRFIRKGDGVKSLREEMWASLRLGQTMDREWMLALLSAATKSNLVAEKRGRIIKWAGRVAGFFVPGGETLAEGVKEVVSKGGELLVDVAASQIEDVTLKNARKRAEWYYALQKITMMRK